MTAWTEEFRFFARAGAELAEAREKHPGEEGVLTDAEWLAVLTEEVGECARAIQDEDDEALRKELAQVAAMACRWALSIPRGRIRPPWATRHERTDPWEGTLGFHAARFEVDGRGVCIRRFTIER